MIVVSRHRAPSGQRGRTLIELIIALSISVGILFGMSVYYETASKSARVAHQMSSLNEEAPLAMLMIGQAIKRAGYGEIIGTGYIGTGQTMFDGPHLRACRSGTFTNPAAGDFSCTAGPAGSPDALMVRFQADSVVAPDQFGTMNCAGGAAVPTPIANPAHVANGTAVPIIENIYTISFQRMLCSGNGSAPEVLAHDVVDFKVFFGYDQAGATLALAGGAGVAPLASMIVDPDFVAAAQAAFVSPTVSAWDFVVSVHACVVMKTRDAASTVISGPYAYTGCPRTPAEVASGNGPALSSSDGTIHKTFSQVFTVRSRATGSPSISM